MKPHIFIGSSTESLALAYALQANLEHDSHVTVWTGGVFDLSTPSLDQLFKVLETADFAGFIFSPDDVVHMRGTEEHTVRDNVIFQLGAFIARTGAARVFVILPRNVELKLPSDLIGLMTLTYDSQRADANLQAALGPVSNTIRKAMANLGLIGGELKNSIKGIIRETTTTTPPQETEQVEVPMKLLREINERLTRIAPNEESNEVNKNTVFLSYRFAEREYIDALTAILKRDGFEVVTAERTNTYISKAILERIKSSEFFLSLMTKVDEKVDGSFTTSPWLLEEKGAALAYRKQIVMLVEDGVKDIGGLQGDWQRIHFTPKGFATAALQAADQLESYVR